MSVASILVPAAGAAAAAPLQTCQPAETRATERHWRFGDGAAMDFSVAGNAAPTVGSSGHGSVEGTTVVTDTAGNMLFWSNGQQVFDRNDGLMPTSTGPNLLGNPSATQTVAAFPSLGNPGLFFIVTTSSDTGPGTLTYSVVDMAARGGLGDVVSTRKSVQLGATGTASEAITAVPNHDGTGYWVVTYTQGSPNMLAYEFDADGPVTGSPVVSVMPTSHGSGYGSISSSPDLSQLVVMADSGTNGTPARMRLLEIDGETGVLTQTSEWGTGTAGNRGYYADFSPSGDYVYATRIFGGGSLYRYDVRSPNDGAAIAASEQLVGGLGTNGGAVRRGPDGRMYAARRNTAALATVRAPDAADIADIDFQVSGQALADANGWGLPQTVTGCPRSVSGTKTVANITDPGEPAEPGDVLEYVVEYANHVTGTPAGDFVITDAIPAGTTYVAGTIVTASGNPGAVGPRTDIAGDDNAEFVAATGRIVYRAGAGANATDGGVLDSDESVGFRFRVRVGAAVAGGKVKNVANATYSTLPGVEITEATPEAGVTFNPVSDLTLTKTASPTRVTAGGNVTYSLSVGNNGPSASPSATVTDVLPAGLTYLSGDPGCAAVGQTVTCAAGALASGATALKEIVVTVAAGSTGAIANSASVSGPLTDSNTGNSSGTATITSFLPPTVAVNGPADGTDITQDGDVPGTFTCTPGAAPLACTATIELPDGSTVPFTSGDDLPTGEPGTYEITVKVVDDLGVTRTTTSTYVVHAPPVVTISGPAPRLKVGEKVPSDATCDASAGLAAPSCTATIELPDGTTVPFTPGDDVPTDVPGEYEITVKSIDELGRETTSTRTYTVFGPPTVAIDGPKPDQQIGVGTKVPGTFTCAGGAPALKCGATVRTPDGKIVPLRPGGDLPTDVPGTYEITVTVEDELGQPRTTTRRYTVHGPAVVTITGPAVGTELPVGGTPTAGFTCAEGVAPLVCGATIRRPDGTTVELRDGDPLPTDVPGTYTITVTSVDALGRKVVGTRTYVVVAARKPALRITTRLSRTTVRPGQTVQVRVRVTNPTKVTLRNVRVCTRVPAGLRYVSASPKAKRSKGQYCWTIKTLRPGKFVARALNTRAVNRPGRVVARTTGRAAGVRDGNANAAVRILAPRTRAGGVTG